MEPFLSSITISTAQLPNMLKFYTSLGCLFRESQVDKGSKMYRSIASGVEFVLYGQSSTDKNSKPQIQLTFKVSGLEKMVESLKQIPNVHCILDPSQMVDGKKAIVLDPDGHSIELTEMAK